MLVMRAVVTLGSSEAGAAVTVLVMGGPPVAILGAVMVTVMVMVKVMRGPPVAVLVMGGPPVAILGMGTSEAVRGAAMREGVELLEVGLGAVVELVEVGLGVVELLVEVGLGAVVELLEVGLGVVELLEVALGSSSCSIASSPR